MIDAEYGVVSEPSGCAVSLIARDCGLKSGQMHVCLFGLPRDGRPLIAWARMLIGDWLNNHEQRHQFENDEVLLREAFGAIGVADSELHIDLSLQDCEPEMAAVMEVFLRRNLVDAGMVSDVRVAIEPLAALS